MPVSRRQRSSAETNEARDIRTYSAVTLFPASVREIGCSSFQEWSKNLAKNMRTLSLIVRTSEHLAEQPLKTKLTELASALESANNYQSLEIQQAFPKFRKGVFSLLQPEVYDALQATLCGLRDGDQAALRAARSVRITHLRYASEQVKAARERRSGDNAFDAAMTTYLQRVSLVLSRQPTSLDHVPRRLRTVVWQNMNLEMTAFEPTLQELRDMSERLAQGAEGYEKAAYLDSWVSEAMTVHEAYVEWLARGVDDDILKAFERSMSNVREIIDEVKTHCKNPPDLTTPYLQMLSILEQRVGLMLSVLSA